METIARVRREFFVRERRIMEIARDRHVSRNTVRKILRSGETAFSYERETQPMPRIGPWRDQLDAMLAANETKPSRERLTRPAAAVDRLSQRKTCGTTCGAVR